MVVVQVPRVAVNAGLPEMPTAETISGAVPVFVTVVSFAVVDPAALTPNATPARVAVVGGGTPAPVSPMTIGDGVLPAVWAIESDADLEPVVVGRNVTLSVHVPAGGTAAVQPLVTVNSAASVPVLVTTGCGSDAVPVLLIVTVRATEVVLVTWLPKASDAGATAIAGARPVPVSGTVFGELRSFE